MVEKIPIQNVTQPLKYLIQKPTHQLCTSNFTLESSFSRFFLCHYASMIGAFPLPFSHSWATPIHLILKTMILRLSFSSQI